MEGNVKEGCNQQRAQGTTAWSSRRRSADLVTLLRMSYSVLPRWEHLGLTDLLTSFPGDSVLKNPLARAADARDMGFIPGSGISPGERNGNPLWYSCLDSPVDSGDWWAVAHSVTKSGT